MAVVAAERLLVVAVGEALERWTRLTQPIDFASLNWPLSIV
jgi:hypothetical protein